MQVIYCNANQDGVAPTLTIAIPTYGRPKSLKRLIASLLPQLRADTELLVIDNASVAPVAESIEGLNLDGSVASIRVICNASNVGASANVLRCFELATAPWLWIVGDEEIPDLHAVHQILCDIKEHPGSVLLKYGSDVIAEQTQSITVKTVSRGLSATIEDMPCFSNFLFLSSSVFQRRVLTLHLAKAYPFCWAFCPHVALLFSYLRLDGGECVFLPFRPASNGTGTEGGHWDGTHVTARLHELLTLVPGSVDRRVLANKMQFTPRQSRVSLRSLLILAAKGNFEMLDNLIIDEMASYKIERAALRRISCRSVLKLLLNELLSKSRKAIYMFARTTGLWSRHPGVPGTDLTSRFLGDTRV